MDLVSRLTTGDASWAVSDAHVYVRPSTAPGGGALTKADKVQATTRVNPITWEEVKAR